MDWIKISDQPPNILGDALFLIEDKIFIGKVQKYSEAICIIFSDFQKCIYFEMDNDFLSSQIFGDPYYKKGKKFYNIPSYVKKPTHWIPLPEIPKQTDAPCPEHTKSNCDNS